jgi:hypothetical protein
MRSKVKYCDQAGMEAIKMEEERGRRVKEAYFGYVLAVGSKSKPGGVLETGTS